MLSKIIAFPFLIALIWAGYMTFENDAVYANWMIPSVVALAAIYMLSPQIDWWWYKRNPPQLDDHMKTILKTHFPFYLEMSSENKKTFGERLNLYIMANDFIPKVFEQIPEEIKGYIGACLVQMTYGRDNYRLPKFERIVLYPTPFLSPQHPNKYHSSEIFAEDGVSIFSVEQLIPGCKNPRRSYNVAMHEFAKIYMIEYPEMDYPQTNEDTWDQLHKISHFSKKYLEEYIGLAQPDPLPVMVNHFFNFSKEFKAELPEEYEKLKIAFNLDPLNLYDPIVDRSLIKKDLVESSGV